MSLTKPATDANLVVDRWVSNAVNDFPLNRPIGANFVADEALFLSVPNEA